MRTRGPRMGSKPASRGSEKSHLLGAAPWSSTPQGGPLYGWKKRGIFAVVGSGQRGQGVCLHIRQVLAHRAKVSEPHGARGSLIAGFRCPAGDKGRSGHSPGERGRLALREFPGKYPPRPWSQSLCCAQCLCEAGSASGQCAPAEIAWSARWQGGLLCPRTGAQGNCETAVTSQGCVT